MSKLGIYEVIKSYIGKYDVINKKQQNYTL